jgi:levansucrase
LLGVHFQTKYFAIDCEYGRSFMNGRTRGRLNWIIGTDKVLKRRIQNQSLSSWLPEHVAAIAGSRVPEIPLIRAADIFDILPGFQLWDSWTIDAPDGSAVLFDGWRGWVIMCAPRSVHPDLRHDIARLRLMQERDGEWRDCGYLLPDDLNPGSREWAGTAVLQPDNGKLTLFYTVTGRRGDGSKTFEQRLFQAEGRLSFADGSLTASDWQTPIENIVADGIDYVIVNQHEGKPGAIKGFRDPFHFRDPADGTDYLLFTASAAASKSEYNGVIGLASSTDGRFERWVLHPPLFSADGVNNELERPICRHIDGCYYVFWSTQRKTFAPSGPTGPNGLYGMVAENLFGPYRPLNGTGLVAPNPLEEPYQSYSWWVDSDLNVTGFVDLWNLGGQDPVANPDLVERHFGGVPAPTFRIALGGDKAQILGR